MKKITPKTNFKLNQNTPGKNVKGAMFNIGSQPPKKRVVASELINNIFAYSPKKNKANVMAEYSTLYPDTNSASASGKSNGCLLVSASIDTKKRKNIGSKGIKYHTYFCDNTTQLKLKEPEHIATVAITNPIDTSYEII